MSTQENHQTSEIQFKINNWIVSEKNKASHNRDALFNQQVVNLLKLFTELQLKIANENLGDKEFEHEVKQTIGKISITSLLLFNIATGKEYPFWDKEDPVAGFSPNGFSGKLFVELSKISKTRELQFRESDHSDYSKSIGAILDLVARYAKRNTATLSDCISLIVS